MLVQINITDKLQIVYGRHDLVTNDHYGQYAVLNLAEL